MPELPEVETWRAVLDKVANGKVVKTVECPVDDPKVLVGTSREDILSELPGSCCTGVFVRLFKRAQKCDFHGTDAYLHT